MVLTHCQLVVIKSNISLVPVKFDVDTLKEGTQLDTGPEEALHKSKCPDVNMYK